MIDELISKKSLLKDLDSVIAQYNWEEDGVIMDILECVRDMIFDQPTAYDIEKITKILGEKARNCQNNAKYYRGKAEWMSKAYQDAIEVVKGDTE